eukprot:gene9480-12771_t
MMESPRDIKYMNVPFISSDMELENVSKSDDNLFGMIGSSDDFNDFESQLNAKKSSLFLNRMVSAGIVFGLILSVTCFFIWYMINISHNGGHVIDDDDTNNAALCYTKPSCNKIDSTSLYNVHTGFTNITGWTADESCCSLCDNIQSPVVCFPNTTYKVSCSLKSGAPNDYDYLVFDQIWMPQLCSALKQGHDPTLSHLENSLCTTSALSGTPRLTIHGLWPNYYGGYPQCCDATQSSNDVLIASEVEQWPIWEELSYNWFDPTTTLSNSNHTNCSICYILNHEYEKHGTCFSSNSPEQYFSSGLQINTLLSNTNQVINSYVTYKEILTSNITALYPKAVNVLCDPQESHLTNSDLSIINVKKIGVLLEIQTCWVVSKNNHISPNSATVFEMIDCPTASTTTFTEPCPSRITLINFS